MIFDWVPREKALINRVSSVENKRRAQGEEGAI
jgi:hypothetical protein